MAGIGPVEYLVIGFPGNRFKGEIVPAIAELVDNDLVHILDVLFIKKDADGTVTGFEYDALDDVLEFGFAEVDGEAGDMLNDEDIQLAAEVLEPDSSAALIVWEDRWAAPVAQAIRDAGGPDAARQRRWLAGGTPPPSGPPDLRGVRRCRPGVAREHRRRRGLHGLILQPSRPVSPHSSAANHPERGDGEWCPVVWCRYCG